VQVIRSSTPVVVLGAAHHGDLGVVRTLGRLNIPVYLAEANRSAPAVVSRYCSEWLPWDFDRASTQQSLEFLNKLGGMCCDRHGVRPVLLPTTDVGSLFVAANAQELRQRFVFPEQSLSLVESLYDKRQMYLLARGLGIPAPQTFFPESRQDVLNFAPAATYPLILKPIDSRHVKTAAARRKAVVRNTAELLTNYDRMANPDCPNLMLQEFVPGGEDANWMFNGYFDAESKCLFGVTAKKLRQSPPYSGIASLGICVPNPTLRETVVKFMQAIGYRGILDCGFRFDARDGQYKVFDINPRIGCTFRLFVSLTGMDVARAQYLDLTSQPVDSGTVPIGRKWILEDFDLVSSFRYWREGKLGLLPWMRSFAGLAECAYFAADDLHPVTRKCLNLFSPRFKRRSLPAAEHLQAGKANRRTVEEVAQ
jgi:D-aspartate ligase